MNKKPLKARITAVTTAILTMTAMCLPAAAFASSSGVTKEETVYVVTDSSGTQQDVIVSDHLINKDKIKTISDETNLSDVENVKGEETFKQDGDALTWDAEGNGIYYQGKSSDEIPVSMDVVYRLDDKVVSGPELQGKSGKVEIKINYENDAEYEGTTVPFVVMTGLIVTDDSFKNIKISKGKVIDDGEKLLVVGMAAPGLAQTLGIGESDLGIGSSVTITGDAEKFAVEDMMTIVTNAFFEDVDSDGIDMDYDDEINALNNGSKALVDGSNQLYEGLDNLADNMPELKEGVSQLNSGSKQLRGTLKSKMKQIASATDQLNNGTSVILSKLQDMKTGLDKGNGTPTNPGAIKALDQVSSGLAEGAQEAVTGAEALKTSASQLDSGIEKIGELDQSLSNGIAQAEPNLQQVNENYNKLNTKTEALDASTVEKLKTVVGASGIDETQQKEIIGVMDSYLGYKTLSDGAVALANTEANGMVLAEAGASQIYEGLKDVPNQLVTAADELSESADGIQTASEVVGTVRDGLKSMSEGLGSYDKNAKEQTTLIGGMTVIDSGLEQMHHQIEQSVSKSGPLTKVLNQFVNGTGELKKGTNQMSDGVDKLDNGSKKLAKGMRELYNDGIKQIIDMYNNDLKGTLSSVEGMLEAGKNYKTFTKLPDGMDGNVKFIYKTDITK